MLYLSPLHPKSKPKCQVPGLTCIRQGLAASARFLKALLLLCSCHNGPVTGVLWRKLQLSHPPSMCAQVTTVSAFHLHLLNLLAYCFVEAFLVHEFGWTAFVRGGFRNLLAVVALCGALPLAVNASIEMQSRRDFLHRNRAHPVARREWLRSY